MREALTIELQTEPTTVECADVATLLEVVGTVPVLEVVAPAQVVELVQDSTDVEVFLLWGGRKGNTGEQGIPGPPSVSVYRTASGAIGGHRVVRSVSATAVGYASAADASHGDDTIGVTTQAAVDGASIEVQRTGTLTHAGWTWTQGERIYLGADGSLTQTVPDETHAFIQVVGHAEASDSMFIKIESPIYY